jgi:hypothetical protein
MVSLAITDPNDANCDNTLFFFIPSPFLVQYAKEYIHRNGLSKATTTLFLHASPLHFHVIPTLSVISQTASTSQLIFICAFSANPFLRRHFSASTNLFSTTVLSTTVLLHRFFSRLVSLPSHYFLQIFHPSTPVFPFQALCPFSFSRETSHALRILTSSATMASPASAVPVLPPMSLVLSPASMAARTASSTILASWARFREYRNIMATERMVPMGFYK